MGRPGLARTYKVVPPGCGGRLCMVGGGLVHIEHAVRLAVAWRARRLWQWRPKPRPLSED